MIAEIGWTYRDRTVKNLIFHILFWVAYLALNALVLSHFYEPPGQSLFADTLILSLKFQVVELPGKLILVYTNLFFLLPWFLLRQKYWSYLTLLILSFILVRYIQQFFVAFVMLPLMFPKIVIGEEMFSWGRFVQYSAGAFSLLIFTSALKLMYDHHLNSKKIQEIEKRQLSTELQLLKTQLNPHFFFNTLNNLYGLALENSSKTADMILRLSEMMNYVLYEAQNKLVLVERELEVLKNYIELEKMRYSDQVEISFTQQGDFAATKIPPLLLVPFLENAFKHGLRGPQGKNWLRIEVNRSDKQFLFVAENSKNGQDPKQSADRGIGLVNVKRRLEILFPNAHTLNLVNTDDRYRAELTITI